MNISDLDNLGAFYNNKSARDEAQSMKDELSTLNREQRRRLKKSTGKKDPLKNSLKNNKSWYELISTYESIKKFHDEIKDSLSNLSVIINEESSKIESAEIKQELLQYEKEAIEALKEADSKIQSIYDKHKNIKRGLKDYEEYITVLDLYVEYQDTTVKYTGIVVQNTEKIKKILTTNVIDSQANSLNSANIGTDTLIDVVNKVMTDDVIIPEYLLNNQGETK